MGMLMHETLMRLLKKKDAAPAPVTPKPQPKKAKPKARRVKADAPTD